MEHISTQLFGKMSRLGNIIFFITSKKLNEPITH